MNKYTLLILIVIVTAISSCTAYKQRNYSGEELYRRPNFHTNYDQLVYIVHTPDTSYQLKNIKLKDQVLSGETAPVIETRRRKPKRVRLSEIHVYLKEDSVDTALPKTSDSTISLNKEKIKTVRMYAKERKGLLGILLTIVLVIVGVFVLLLLSLLALIGSGDSDSDSGGSDSDSGGGGGGGGGGSCYVATMTYGSYDAPEVLVLRRFRDKFLKHTKAGRCFIAWYYKNSPGFVAKHQNNKVARQFVKYCLDPFVYFIGIFYKK